MPPTATYFQGTGRRKSAVARVRLFAGDGAVIVNGKPVEDYFGRLLYQQVVEHAFRVSETLGKFNTTVRVDGGGVTGQAEAVRHGIARALCRANEELRPILSKAGLLTRDARERERKKYGLKRARKAPQYTKR
ncbi:MAG TPA: 30S ribosomal protein S9 [Chloroflexota bacterium]|jgi:small subunit ribosomal protein S9|nr:30S ribosomal protein S9 [Chloroflexota bacterium]